MLLERQKKAPASARTFEEDKDIYKIIFYAVISFGSSIKNVTEEVLDQLQSQMQTMFPEYGGCLTLKIVGVKSKHVAERDIEVKREYEPARSSFVHQRSGRKKNGEPNGFCINCKLRSGDVKPPHS